MSAFKIIKHIVHIFFNAALMVLALTGLHTIMFMPTQHEAVWTWRVIVILFMMSIFLYMGVALGKGRKLHIQDVGIAALGALIMPLAQIGYLVWDCGVQNWFDRMMSFTNPPFAIGWAILIYEVAVLTGSEVWIKAYREFKVSAGAFRSAVKRNGLKSVLKNGLSEVTERSRKIYHSDGQNK